MSSWKPSALRRTLEVPKGEVNVKVVDVEERKTRVSGEDATRVTFEVTNDGQHKGLRIFEHFLPNKRVGQQRLLLLLRAVGLDDREEVQPKDLLGKTLLVSLQSSEYLGVPQPRIKKFLSSEAKRSEPTRK